MEDNYLKIELYEMLKKDEQIFDFIQEVCLDGMWYWDLENPENEWMNKRFWDVLGYDADEMPSSPSSWKSIIDQDDLKKANENFYKHLADENFPYKQIVKYRHKNGSIVFIKCYGKAIRDENNKPLRMLGVHHNITNLTSIQEHLLQSNAELKQKNIELSKSANLLNEAQKITHIGAWELDIATGQTFWTDEVYEIHELPKDFEHNKINGIEFYHPDYRPIISQAINDTIEKHIPFNVKCKFITAKGNERWVNASGYPIIENGKVTHLNGLFQDVTDQENTIYLLNRKNSILDLVNKLQKIYLEDSNSNEVFESALQMLLQITNSEYGFIGEVLYNVNGEPYLKTKAITNIAWNEETRKFYDDYAPEGLEFTNLKTLFGNVLTSGQPMIANHPSSHPQRGGLPEGHPPLNAFLGLPLYVGSKMIGMAGVSNKIGGYNQEIITEIEPLTTTIGQLIDSQKSKLLLKESQIQYKSLVLNIPGMTYRCKYDEHYTMIFISGEVDYVSGYPVSDFLNNAIRSYSSIIHPDDLPMVDLEVAKGVENKSHWEIEYRIIHKDESIRWVYEKGIGNYNSNGDLEYLDGFVLDITEKKKVELLNKETNLRLILATRAANVGVWDFDIVNNKLIWDDQMFSLYGIKRESFSGEYEAWRSGMHPEDSENADLEIQLALKGEKDFNTEFRVVWPDGSVHHIRALALIIRDDNGKPIRMIGTNWDITQEKQISEKLIIAKQTAEKASKAKSEFLSNMSHEIRTPLNGVIGFTELLKDTPLLPEQQEYVNNANISGHTLLEIINNILDFSKIEAGQMHLEMIKIDIIEILENSIDIVKIEASKKNIELLLNIDSTLPRFAIGDPIRIKQVLTNLLGNALKFTEKGEVELKVKYKQLKNGKGKISFFIRDTGIGITVEQQKGLFQSFAQADSSTTRKYGGTGLGLVISDLIVQRMGSKIYIDSTFGEGSIFHFEIITDTEEGEVLYKGNIENIKRCMIIDDNANNRFILEEMLSKWSIVCESFEDGISALKTLENSTPFDLIICDYNMPFIDGLETIRLMREKLKMTPEKLPVILLHSSSESTEIQQKCEELGVRFTLTKPVKSSDMFAYLSKVNEPFKKNNSINSTLSSTSNTLQNNTFKILIADDVPMNIAMVKAVVSHIMPSAQLIVANDGESAIKQFADTSPDLIFMDVQMPIMDGLQATKEIRALEKNIGKHIPIIALTAGAFKEEEKKCLEVGMDAFLTKPVQPEKIKIVLEKYLEDKQNKINITHFDRQTLLERCGNEDVMLDLIGIALKNFQDYITKLNIFIQEKNIISIRDKSHQIKGSALNLNLPIIAKIASSMEEMAISDENLPVLKHKYKTLLAEWEIVKELLK